MSGGPDLDVKRCAKCAAWIPSTATMCAYCNSTSPDEPLGRSPGPALSLRHGVSVTNALLVANALFFVFSIAVSGMRGLPGNPLQWTLTGTGFVQGVWLAGGSFAPSVEAGEWWRLVTANYLHFGLWHIALNMFALRDLGRVAERIFGPSKLLVVWFVSGVGCALAMTLLSSKMGAGRMPGVGAGASGAICGLLGLLLVYYRQASTSRGAEIRSSLIRSGIATLGVGLILPIGSTIGHVAGGVVGAGCGFLIRDAFGARMRPGSEKRWSLVAALCVVVTIVCLATAVRFAVTTDINGA